MLVTSDFFVDISDPQLLGNINLTNAGSVRWNVSVPGDELPIQQNYVLRFLTAPGNHSGFSSPGFLGLSTGAKAGIGTAVPIAVLALAGGLVCMFLRNRKSGRKSDDFLNAPKMDKYRDTPLPSYPLEIASWQQPIVAEQSAAT